MKPEGIFHHWTTKQLFAHSRQLEQELSEATAELERTKEQLRVARETIQRSEKLIDVGRDLLIESTAELEQAKDQLRVARERYECVRHTASMGDMKGVLSILDALFPLFTQPKPSADSPEGADPVKATTFPA